MISSEITSRKNPLIREYVLLSDSAQHRREKRLFPAEGARLCADAAASGLRIASLFFTPEAEEKYAAYLQVIRRSAPREFLISGPVAELLSDTRSPQGVFCLCGMPEDTGSFPTPDAGSRFLLLEDLQDPANLGAVLRTAEALGIGGVLLCGECCDAYSPKALRAGMGAAFRVPLYRCPDAPEAVRRLNALGVATFAAVPDSSAEAVDAVRFSGPSAAAVGNEGNGLSEAVRLACTRRITIPMRGRAESLNAAASAAILMWEMMRSAPEGGVLRDE